MLHISFMNFVLCRRWVFASSREGKTVDSTQVSFNLGHNKGSAVDVWEWQIDEDDAQKALQERAQNANLTDDERLDAEHAMGVPDDATQDTQTLLNLALESQTRGHRSKAVRSLSLKSPEDLLTVFRKAKCQKTRLEAVSALRSFSARGPISKELATLCADKNPQLRVTAFSSLAQSPASQYVVAKTWLSTVHGDRNQHVLALVTLEKQGSQQDLTIIESFRTHECGRVRAAAREAMQAIVSRETKNDARVSQRL